MKTFTLHMAKLVFPHESREALPAPSQPNGALGFAHLAEPVPG